MPNWCANRLQVRGTREEVGRFARIAGNTPNGGVVEDAIVIAETHGNGDAAVANAIIETNRSEHSPFSFAGHVPEPEHKGNDEWYNWRLQHWGTKWDADSASLRLVDENGQWMAEIEFMTAWSPPDQWLAAAYEQHPELRFELLWNEEQGIAGLFSASSDGLWARGVDEQELFELWPSAPFPPFDEIEGEDDVENAAAPGAGSGIAVAVLGSIGIVTAPGV
jgi:hypothetical protein